MTEHLRPIELAAYLRGDTTHAEHVRLCPRCGAVTRIISQTLPDLADVLVDELESLLEEINTRRETAHRAVAELEASFPFRWQSVAESDSRLHTPEAVRRILERAEEVYSSTPRRAYALATSALHSCHRFPASAELRFDTLKDVSWYSLTVCDDIDAAFHILDAASALIELTSDPIIYLAKSQHMRAYIHGHSTVAQWSDALRYLDLCEPTFAARDYRAWRHCRHLRGIVLVRSGRFASALSTLQEQLPLATTKLEHAALCREIATCHVKSYDAIAALPFAEEACALFSTGRDPEPLARAMWAKGEALSALGRHGEAISVLRQVVHFFASAGLHDDELNAQVTLIRALRVGAPDEALSRQLADAYQFACALDAKQPSRSGTLRATLLSELTSAQANGQLSLDLLDHVSSYLSTIGRGDEMPYVPLQ